jgi:uncharacterized protein YbjT (DUF2867 family)
MTLVIGATGFLGTAVCRQLAQSGRKVRALVRDTADAGKRAALETSGAELVRGDLKDAASLAAACRGIDEIVTTASSTLSRQAGDSIETVDRQGILALIAAAREAGVARFVYISIPPNLRFDSPLSRAKREVERALSASGMAWTVLQANYFMEVWLSPALGFDHADGRARVFGPGDQPLAWVSLHDVAGLAVQALDTGATRNRLLAVGGPENLSPLDVVRTFEQVTGRAFAVEHVPVKLLDEQRRSAPDPLSESFAALMLEYAHGVPMQMDDTLALMPRTLTTVRDYAQAVGGHHERSVPV